MPRPSDNRPPNQSRLRGSFLLLLVRLILPLLFEIGANVECLVDFDVDVDVVSRGCQFRMIYAAAVAAAAEGGNEGTSNGAQSGDYISEAMFFIRGGSRR